MTAFFKKIPFPMAGLALAVIGLGMLLDMYGIHCCGTFTVISAIVLAFPLLGCACEPSRLRNIAEDPVMTSVAGTVSMTLMFQSMMLKSYASVLAFIVFGVGIALHLLIVIWFTWRFLFRVPIAKMRGSWLIVYVGAVAFAIASPVFGLAPQGDIVCWACLIIAGIILMLLLVHYFRYSDPEMARPLICVLAAPAAICLVGFFQCEQNVSIPLAVALVIAAWLLCFGLLPLLVKLLRSPFYPSFSAMTFPFVISASAGKRFLMFAQQQSIAVPVFCGWLVWAQLVIAIVLTVFVAIRYLIFLYKVIGQVCTKDQTPTP